MTAIIEASELSKSYRSIGRQPIEALNRIDVLVPPESAGSIVGIIGPNGSGKSTFIRCLLGLVRPTSGSVAVFGADSTTAFSRVCSRVGSLLEEPPFLPRFSGRLNLEILAELQGHAPHAVAESLDLVDLTDRADDPVSSYSLGMRQRLGVAAVLLRDPDLVLLDEPTNGLDPFASRHLWSTMIRLAGEGTTVLVSSHHLSDLERGCSHALVFDRGQVMDNGTVDELRERFARHLVEVEVRNVDRAVSILTGHGFQVTGTGATTLTVDAGADDAEAVNRALAGSGVFASGLSRIRPSLEDSLLRLTANRRAVRS